MILPLLLVVFAVVMSAFYSYLRKQPNRARRWRIALGVGVAVGVGRAALASTGWYVVEHTGGALQVPAFALAMLAWPEAALFAQRRVAPVPLEFYAGLSIALVAGTTFMTSLVAAAVDLTHAAADHT